MAAKSAGQNHLARIKPGDKSPEGPFGARDRLDIRAARRTNAPSSIEGPSRAQATKSYEFMRRCLAFRSAPNTQNTRAAFQAYLDETLPLLKTEEAALQALAVRLAYANLHKGLRIKLDIAESKTGLGSQSGTDPTIFYAKTYEVREKIERRFPRLVMYRLVPVNAPGARPIILFRGTKDLWGWLTNFFPSAVGGTRGLSREERAMLEDWTQEGLAPNGALFVGHSLGGNRCLTALSHIDTEAQKRCHAVTFCSVGVAQKTADGIKAPKDNIRFIESYGDVVHMAGQSFPDGRVYQLHNTKRPTGWHKAAANAVEAHLETLLVDQQLDGQALPVFAPSSHDGRQHYIEQGRAAVGHGGVALLKQGLQRFLRLIFPKPNSTDA